MIKRIHIIIGISIIFAGVIIYFSLKHFYSEYILPVKITQQFLDNMKENKIPKASEFCSDVLGNRICLSKTTPVSGILQYKISGKKYFTVEEQNPTSYLKTLIKEYRNLNDKLNETKKQIEIKKKEIDKKLKYSIDKYYTKNLEKRKIELEKEIIPISTKLYDIERRIEDIGKKFIKSKSKYLEFGPESYNPEKYFPQEKYKIKTADIVVDLKRKTEDKVKDNKVKIRLKKRYQDGWKIVEIETLK